MPEGWLIVGAQLIFSQRVFRQQRRDWDEATFAKAGRIVRPPAHLARVKLTMPLGTEDQSRRKLTLPVLS